MKTRPIYTRLVIAKLPNKIHLRSNFWAIIYTVCLTSIEVTTFTGTFFDDHLVK